MQPSCLPAYSAIAVKCLLRCNPCIRLGTFLFECCLAIQVVTVQCLVHKTHTKAQAHIAQSHVGMSTTYTASTATCRTHSAVQPTARSEHSMLANVHTQIACQVPCLPGAKGAREASSHPRQRNDIKCAWAQARHSAQWAAVVASAQGRNKPFNS